MLWTLNHTPGARVLPLWYLKPLSAGFYLHCSIRKDAPPSRGAVGTPAIISIIRFRALTSKSCPFRLFWLLVVFLFKRSAGLTAFLIFTKVGAISVASAQSLTFWKVKKPRGTTVAFFEVLRVSIARLGSGSP